MFIYKQFVIDLWIYEPLYRQNRLLQIQQKIASLNVTLSCNKSHYMIIIYDTVKQANTQEGARGQEEEEDFA